MADPGSLFVPVWRNQNLVIELQDGEPRAVVLELASIAGILGTSAEQRLSAGEVVFLGVIEERAHFALDLSPIEAPLEMLHSPALAAQRHRRRRRSGLPICARSGRVSSDAKGRCWRSPAR